jgi:nucleoside-diphosphate-sugar epimerase
MRLLVTGATGFVGSHVVHAALARGHDVVAAVRSRSRAAAFDGFPTTHLVEVDLADGHAIRRIAREAAPDLVLHLAWPIGPDFADSRDNLTAVAGSMALLHGLLESRCPRIVFVGSHLELAPSDHDLAETDPALPRSLYATCKDAVRRLAETAVAGTTSAFAWVRLFNLYGPGQPPWAFVPTVVRHLLDGRRCALTAGDQRRGFLHVRDAADALLAVGESSVSGIVHVGSSDVVSVREVALRVAARVGHPELLDFGAMAPPARDASRIVPAIQRLDAEVGFRPRVGLDQGLGETIDWWRARERPTGRA